MLTTIGKVLTFLNFLIGMGILSWSAFVYTQRPGWFDAAPDGVDKGNSPLTFAQLKGEVELRVREANTASAAWGDRWAKLPEREADRDKRKKVFGQWLAEARKNGGKTGFFEVEYEPGTDSLGKDGKSWRVNVAPGNRVAMTGPDKKPLKAVDDLGDTIDADMAKLRDAQSKRDNKPDDRDDDDGLGAIGIDQLRDIQKARTQKILATELELRKLIVVRDAINEELGFLRDFEVNWYEQQLTVYRRKKQLDERLNVVRGRN